MELRVELGAARERPGSRFEPQLPLGRRPPAGALGQAADLSHHRGLHVAEDPNIQARVYLTRAGFAASDLDAVTPLLRTAEQQNKLEKLMTTHLLSDVECR